MDEVNLRPGASSGEKMCKESGAGDASLHCRAIQTHPWEPLSLYLNVILFHLSGQMRRSMLSQPIVRKGFDRRASERGGERHSNIQAEENIQSRSHGDIWMVDSCRVNIYLVPLHSGKWQDMSKVNWLFVHSKQINVFEIL